MRFLVDESTGPGISRWLREQGHDVFCVYERARGMEDEKIIEKAYKENRILITNDKDFGEKVYRDLKQHKGVVLLRLGDERVIAKMAVLKRLLEDYSTRLGNNFTVVTENKVRITRK